MITGGKITKVEGERKKEGKLKKVEINIAIEDVKVNKGEIEVKYKYTADYKDDVGQIVLYGVVNAKEQEKEAKKIKEMWEKEKKLPEQFAVDVANAINFSSALNGPILAKVLLLPPPFFPPTITRKKK